MGMAVHKQYSELREKTHVEAMADGSINNMSVEKLRGLVGFIMPLPRSARPDKKITWEVSLATRGCGYDTISQDAAMMIASLEEIKLLLIKLLKKKEVPTKTSGENFNKLFIKLKQSILNAKHKAFRKE